MKIIRNIVTLLIFILPVNVMAKEGITFSTHLTEGSFLYKRTFDLLNEAFSRIGFDFVLKSYPGKRALMDSNAGETDGEAHRIYGVDKKYSNLVLIPEVQQVVNNYAYTIKDLPINNWRDLAPYSVAVQSGSVFLTEMSRQYAKETYELTTTLQMFRLLETGRIDIVLFTPLGANFILSMKEFSGTKIRRVEPPLTLLPIYAYLHKKHRSLAPKVAKALHDMKVDGTYQNLIKPYK